MTVPSLAIQVNGLLQVSGDNFNTYLQGCNVVTDLRGFVGTSGMKVFLGGYTAINDGGQGMFYWNASGVAPDDGGITTIVPNGAAAGEWTRQTGGTTVSANSPIFPMGRLTLTTGKPVMIADTTAVSTIFYSPCIGSLVPISNGTGFLSYAFSQISLSLDSNSGHTGYQQLGKLFDVFAFINNSAVTLGTGPAWSTSTSRGTGAGTTQISMLNGVWTNTVSISLKIDTTSAQVSVASGQATYLGTMYATANGQTGMVFKPAATAGGNNNILGLYNAYNRVPVYSTSRDSTASWSYATATWRATNAGGTGSGLNNRISFVDGLQQSFIDTSIDNGIRQTGSNAGLIGVNLDSISATPGKASSSGNTIDQGTLCKEQFSPQLGFHFIQGMEYATGATVTFDAVANSAQQQALGISLEM